MTRDELIEKLKGYEWRDIEFKEAAFAVPRDVYETVSAFSNTAGGHIVFGVKKKDGAFDIAGVIDVDKIQNDFLSALRSRSKVSILVPVKESKVDDEKGTVLIFFIPEASRAEKPVHLDGNFRESFIRRGGGDEHCSEDEIRRFIRDASPKPYDSEMLSELSAEHVFDSEIVQWYRRIYAEQHPGRYQTLTDLEFLCEWGLVAETHDALVPTVASIILFGQAKYVRSLVQRPVVDYQRIDTEFAKWTPEERWHDREPVEDNLFRAWWLLVEKFTRLAEKPFSLDIVTLRRDDQPPAYIAFREAAINLLIHQDFGDARRTPTLKIFHDRTLFWNPGDAFATTSQLLDPTEKEVRNPSIVAAFRRIGLSDQAGTGMRTIFKNWRDLGNTPPQIVNDKAEKTFQLGLLRRALVTEEQRVMLATLGVRLSDPEARTFAFACQEEQIDITDVRAVTGATPAEARQILVHLEKEVLLKALEPEDGIYILADHLRGNIAALVAAKPILSAASEQVATGAVAASAGSGGAPLTELTTQQWQVIALCDTPKSLTEIMDRLGVSHRGFFMRKTMQPLIGASLVKMTNPENPTAANQRYVLTEAGVELAAWKQAQKAGPPT